MSSAQEGDAYALATGRPVLFMGGYAGNTPVVSAEDLAALAASGELRYILLGSGGGSSLRAWVTANCAVVRDWSGGAGGRASEGTVLYDCSVLAAGAG